MSHYTNDINEILPLALNCFEKLWNGSPIRLIGVGLVGIINKYDLKEQLAWDNFLTTSLTSDTEKLIKKINYHFKQDILLTGAKLNESNLAKILKCRFDQATIDEIEASEWLNWPPEKISANVEWLITKK
ncbi:hypothetical protein P344_03635 [Spiroplasma mirum ATCC 29335]|uniref:DNA polymerase Y-family little finger domain-containing protein n=1 Tax=Spiroplasma mirum ATCC 29335 TaxID=838561 RepID=W6AL75_9MOLU|nr:hypothetical protein P344_03635 [Spiroplasma mirum ATCC 29335]